MNFLAHFILSGENEKLILGNLIADGVKGKMIENYCLEIRKGIELHRMIDDYTDNHLIFRQTVARLLPFMRKYSSVAVDIFYDHFLALHFNEFSLISLHKASQTAYHILTDNYNLLPLRFKKLLPYMIAQNWLEGYSNLNDLKKIFYGMSRRAKFYSGMENAIDYLIEDYELYENEFYLFFPEIKSFATKKIAEIL